MKQDLRSSHAAHHASAIWEWMERGRAARKEGLTISEWICDFMADLHRKALAKINESKKM